MFKLFDTAILIRFNGEEDSAQVRPAPSWLPEPLSSVPAFACRSRLIRFGITSLQWGLSETCVRVQCLKSGRASVF